MKIITTIVALSFLFLCFNATGQSTAPTRHYYGAKFEPVDGILHGAGQTYHRDTPNGPISQSFLNYKNVLGSGAFPILYMDYTSWNASLPNFFTSLRTRIDSIESNDNRLVVPQLGMVLPPGNQILTDQEVENIIDGLKQLDRQVYFRPGYEANGPWNNLQAQTFVTNYRKIADRVREEELPVAMVWNVVVGDGGVWSAYSSVDDFYPGDEYVDWWSFNVFGPVTFNVPFWEVEVNKFLDAAHTAGKPVLIGEATPQFVGAEDAADWDAWFAKYFARIRNNPGVKAHTYINWDWGATDPADNWTNWLDARLETGHATVRNNYINELNDDIYIHAESGLPEFFREGLAGDFNGDGTVDAADYTTWRDSNGATGLLPYSGADGNGDGKIDSADYEVWKSNFEGQAPADLQGTAIPEPSSAVGVATAIAVTISCFPTRINTWGRRLQ